MGNMLGRGDAYPIPPFRYIGTAEGFHYFNHFWKRKTHFYSEAFRVPVAEIPVSNQFPFGTARAQWRDYEAHCDEAGKLIELVEWKEASNHTSDGIRQPADGLPKPSR